MDIIYNRNYQLGDIYHRKVRSISFNTLDMELKHDTNTKQPFVEITQRKWWHQNGISGERIVTDRIYGNK